MDETEITWTDYMKYRIRLRGFDLDRIEDILRHTAERYFDVVTGRWVAVGRHEDTFVMVPYDQAETRIIPVTIHATSRQQINFRIKSERFRL